MLSQLLVGVFVVGFSACVFAAPANAQDVPDAAAVQPTETNAPARVVILVIDEFDFVPPQNPGEAGNSAVASSEPVTSTLCLADGTGQGKYVGTRTAEVANLPVSHGDLIFDQVVWLVQQGPGAGASCTASVASADWPNSAYQQCVLQNGDEIIVQAVDSDDYTADSVAQRTADLMAYWEERGYHTFVLNMSFVLAPCDPTEFSQRPDDRGNLARYLRGVIAAASRILNLSSAQVTELNALVDGLSVLDAQVTALPAKLEIEGVLKNTDARTTISEIQKQITQPEVQLEFNRFNDNLLPALKLKELNVFQPAAGLEVSVNAVPDYQGILDRITPPVTTVLPMGDLSEHQPIFGGFPGMMAVVTSALDGTPSVYSPDAVTLRWTPPGSPDALTVVWGVQNSTLSAMLLDPVDRSGGSKLCPEIDLDLVDALTLLQFANTDAGKTVLKLPPETQIFAPTNWDPANRYYAQASDLLTNCVNTAASVAQQLDPLQAQLPPVALAVDLAYQSMYASPLDESAVDLSSYAAMAGAPPCTWETLGQETYSMVCNPLTLLLSDTLTISAGVTPTVVAVGAAGNFTYYDFPLAPALYPLVLSVSGVATSAEDRFNPGLVRADVVVPADVLAPLGFSDAIVQGTSFAAPRLAVQMAQHLLARSKDEQACPTFPPLHHEVDWSNADPDEVNLDIPVAAEQFCPPFDD
jgi:hypothetical protein